MRIDLSPEEIKFLQQVLGELPTKSGAFLVMNNIAKQVQEQAPAAPQEQAPSVG